MSGRPQFFQAEMRHFIAGRVRIKIFPKRPWGAHVALKLQDFLGKMEGVRRVEVRPFTGSIIFHFSRNPESAHAFLKMLEGYWRAHAAELGECFQPSRQVHEKTQAVDTVSLFTLAGLGAILAAAFYKRVFFGAALAQGPFSAAGIMSLTATVLLWRKKSALGHRHRLLPVLNGAALVAVAASRSLTAVEILFVGYVSLWMEAKSEQRAARYLAECFPALPQIIDVLEAGTVRSRALSEISVGDVVVVASGRIVPVDGTVTEGWATVDESHLTGRALPRTCGAGRPVYAGSRVLEGTLHVVTEKSPHETLLARIRALVHEGLSQRTELERKAELYSRRTLTWGGWATAGALAVTMDLQRALSVFLVFACPCAMVLAASSVVTTAVAALMGRAVLVKNGRSLEAAPVLDALCFDKTGTLTAGVLSVHAVHLRAPWMSVEEILALGAAAESESSHPVAVALREAAEKTGRTIPTVREREVVPGRGVRAQLEGATVLVGSEAFVRDQGVSVSYFSKKAAEHRHHGRLTVYVVKDNRLQALVVLRASALEDLSQFLEALRNEGVRRIELLSGDSSAAVRRFAQGLGFDECLGDLDPQAKARRVEELQQQGYRVGMIGDGINDTPAFSRAHVAVALGPQGAAAALETADVVFLDGQIRKLLLLRRVGRKMLQLAHWNFTLALASNILGALAAVTGNLGAGATGLLHVAHSGVILANSVRMFRAGSEDVTAMSRN